MTDQAIQEFKGSPQSSLATADVASNRALAEVQAAMVVAKRFPRDETAAFASIMKACQRITMAEQAMYSYPRGGKAVTGPSIRLAEVLARSWGNIDFGIVELEQRNGESSMMTYAWDLETNTRQTKVFTVPHERKARGAIVRLDDPRDIYELNANMAARRLRACILGIIPGDIVDAALEQCEATMKGSSKVPLIDRVRKVVVAFDEFSVTKAQIELRFGHTLETLNETEFVQLRKIYQSIRDGMSKSSDWFKPEVRGGGEPEPANGEPKPKKGLDALTEKMQAEQAKPAKTAEPLEPKQNQPGGADGDVDDDADGGPTLEEMAEDEKAHATGKGDADGDGRDYQLEHEQEKPKPKTTNKPKGQNKK